MGRPTGVTIIAVLMAIAGVVMIVAGISTIAFPPFIPTTIQSQNLPAGMFTMMLGGIAAGSGTFMLALGIAGLVISYGHFKGKGWAWTAAVVLSIIGIVMSVVAIVTGNFGSVIIDGFILYYLYRRHLKAYFGKAMSAPAADAAAA